MKGFHIGDAICFTNRESARLLKRIQTYTRLLASADSAAQRMNESREFKPVRRTVKTSMLVRHRLAQVMVTQKIGQPDFRFMGCRGDSARMAG